MTNVNPKNYGLIIVAAPSGAGKSTLCAHLLRDLSEKVSLSISSTSRLPRGSEKHGQEYFFLKEDEFKEKINQGEFAEWAFVHGNYYGTSIRTIENFWSQGKHVLLDIDVQGADSLRKAFPGKTFTLFIAPPSLDELERRLRSRGTESDEAIARRMKHAIEEMKCQDHFDQVLINDDYDKTYQQLKKSVLDFMEEMQGR